MIVRRLSWRDPAPELADQLSRFSIFTSPHFVALFEPLKGRGGYFVVGDSAAIAAIPVVEFGRSALTRLQALPDGLYVPIWVAPAYVERATELRAELLDAIAKRGYFKTTITDFGNLIEATGWQTIEREAHQLALHGTASELPWEPPDKTLRAEIAKSVRDGVEVVPFDASRQMTSFLRLMRQTEQRHGRAPKYPDEFWKKLAALAEVDTRVRWYCVNAGEEMASAHIFLLDRGTALNWQIYYDKRFSSLKANQAITAFAANQFSREGINFLNLGATPAEAVGVETYKQKWGGTAYRYKILQRKSWLGRLL